MNRTKRRIIAYVICLAFIVALAYPLTRNTVANAATKGDGVSKPLLTEDFEAAMIVGKFNSSTDGNTYYAETDSRTGGTYWMRSAWAVVTSDANPKASDSSYNYSANNEYMKLTYNYQTADIFGVESTYNSTNESYYKDKRPTQYDNYAHNPGFVLYSGEGVTKFTGEPGMEYKMYVDVALVENDGKRVQLYLMSNYSPSAATAAYGEAMYAVEKYKPSEANGDVLICDTAATDAKKLNVQSKSGYSWQTFEVVYKAKPGYSPVIMMVTNGGVAVSATASKKNYACAYVDNIKLYNNGLYIATANPDGSPLMVKYEEGDKLSDVEPTVAGWTDDGKWYSDVKCENISTDTFPQEGKTYYRKWHKEFLLDFEADYQTKSGTSYYGDVFNDEYHISSDYYARKSIGGNYKIALSYINDNLLYREVHGWRGWTESFTNYVNSPSISIYDPSVQARLTGSPDFEYKVSFDYEFTGKMPDYDIQLQLVLAPISSGSTIVCGIFDIDGLSGRTNELKVTAVDGYYPRIRMVTNGGEKLEKNPEEYHTVYIDNLKVEELYPENGTPVSIQFDSDGGSYVTGYRILAGNTAGTFPSTSKSGYLFDCWYLADDPSQKEVGSDAVFNDNVVLKAKWTGIQAKNYENSSLDEFSVINYPNVIEDFSDLNTDTLLEDGISNSISTVSNRYIKQGCPDNMNGALLLANKPAVMSNNTNGLPAIALLNRDGTKFAVKKDTRYQISFDYLPLGDSNAHTYVTVYYGSYSAYSVNANCVALENCAVHGLDSKAKTFSQYFYAKQDGFVFFTIGSRASMNDTKSEHFVLIDNIHIDIKSGAKYNEYKNADGSAYNSKPYGYNVQFGMPGDKIRDFGFPNVKGKDIEGFYTDIACTKKCLDYDTIGSADRTIYVKYKDVEYNTVSDFSQPIKLDFETSEDFDLDVMYRYNMYMSHSSTDKQTELDYIPDDSKNAAGGKGYIRLYDIQHCYGNMYFTLYDKSNPSGIMILEPNSSYRITAQAKYEDDAKLPYLRTWFVDLETGALTRNYDCCLSSSLDDVTGYTEVSGVFITGEKSTAVAIGAVYLSEQDVYIDNVAVEKLKQYTLKLDVGDADPMDDIITLPYVQIEDPGAAFKIGYDFIGWYKDKEFTMPFDFYADYITGDTVIYAKFEKEAELPDAEDDFDFEDVDYDLEDEDEEIDYGNPPDILPDNTKIKDVVVESGGFSDILVPIIVLSSIVFVCAGFTAALLIIKKKKELNRGA